MSVPFGFDDPYASPGFLLWRVSGAWQRQIRASLRDLELTHAQFVFLATLAWQQSHGEVTQAGLAQLIGMDVMTASQLARDLEKRALLERPTKIGDARARTLRVTARGLEVVQVAVPLVEAADAAFFKPLESNETFIRGLRKLIGVT